jgi:hypothetical protein
LNECLTEEQPSEAKVLTLEEVQRQISGKADAVKYSDLDVQFEEKLKLNKDSDELEEEKDLFEDDVTLVEDIKIEEPIEASPPQPQIEPHGFANVSPQTTQEAMLLQQQALLH